MLLLANILTLTGQEQDTRYNTSIINKIWEFKNYITGKSF